MYDCLIVGGGAIGLSLAYELSGIGWKICVVDQQQPGRESSWAGAGLLPPCLSRIGHPALDSMVAMSNRLHEQWAGKLLSETGIDNEYQQCGALLLATSGAIQSDLNDDARYWHQKEIRLDKVDVHDLSEYEPAIASHNILEAYHTPDEVQLRNPRHLQALLAACRRRGVEILRDTQINGFERQGDCITAANSASGPIEAANFCICGGAWSTSLLETFNLPVSVRPMRGQIVLLKLEQQILKHVIYNGPHYLVPRADGHVLIGSTVEDVGFDKSTTEEAVSAMLDFAYRVVPQLAEASVERVWAGLRPATPDGRPYMDRIPDTSNCFVAAGHFRCGLQLSTATAVLMRELMTHETPSLDLSAFSLTRDSFAVS
jgi:glycine oxidase